MKSSVSANPALLSLLLDVCQHGGAIRMAYLYLILPANGYAIAATDWQTDITAGTPPTTYRTSTFGKWNSGAITSVAGFSPKSNSMDLSVIADDTVMFPGTTVPLLQACSAGLLDKAQVWVFAAYDRMPHPGQPPTFDTSRGLETKFYGTIASISEIDRVHCEFDVADQFYLLNLSSPPYVIQQSCYWGFGDQNCTVNLASFTQSAMVAAGTTTQTIYPASPFTAQSSPAGGTVPLSRLAQGILTFTSGGNSGLTYTVASYNADGSVSLDTPTLAQPQVGDTFTVTYGCDRTQVACNLYLGPTNYPKHYPGSPYVPWPETIMGLVPIWPIMLLLHGHPNAFNGLLKLGEWLLKVLGL